MSQSPVASPARFQSDRAKMTTQNQPGRKPFVFGAERSTSTTSSPERPQTFFDCLEQQDQKHDTSLGSPRPAHITAETRNGEAEEQEPSSEPARTFDNPSATTANRFSRIGNGLEHFNIIGPSTESGKAPSSLFGNRLPSDSEAATRPSDYYETPGGLFGFFGDPRPSTAAIGKPISSDSGTAAPSLFGHPPPAQTPGGLFSASATSNKREDQGPGFGPPNTRGSSSQSIKDPPSVFDLPPPQAGSTSSSLFGNINPSNYGRTPSAPSEGTSVFGGATSARASGGLFGAPTTSNKHEHQGTCSVWPDVRGTPAQSTKNPPSVFDLPPAQAGNTSSSLFGNLQSNYGQSPSAPSEGTSLFGGAPSGQASSGLFGTSTTAQTSGGLFGAPIQTSGGLFGTSKPAQPSGALFGSSAPAQTSSSLFGASTPAQPPGGPFGASAPAQASGGLFGTSISAQTLGASAPAQTSGGLFGGSTPVPSSNPFSGLRPAPPAQTSGSSFEASTPALTSGGQFAPSAPAQASGSVFGAATPARMSDGLFGAAIPAPSSNMFSALRPAQTSFSPFEASTPALTFGGLFAASAPAQASGASEAGAPPKLSGQNLHTKADEAWTQQESKIQLALSSLQDAQTYGQEAHNSIRQERDQLQDQIKHLEKQLEEKQTRVVAMTEQIEKANEQANQQIQKMRRYFSGSGRPPSGTFNEDEWFFDCAANRKFGAMYACLRQMFSGEIHPLDFLETIKPEDVWYDPFNLCLRREVLLKDGHVYLRTSEGPSVASDAGKILASPQVEKNQTQITDTFKPNIQPEANPAGNKNKSDTSNVVPEPAAPGNGSKVKTAKDTVGKIIKGRHGRIMSLGPSTSQTEETPGLAKPSEASRTESTKALAGPTPTDENNNNPIQPSPTRSRSDSTPLPIRGKRSSSARPISKDENDSAKQAPTPAIRPLIKEEWLTNEQRVSRIRKEEDETVERAMLRKRQQRGQ